MGKKRKGRQSEITETLNHSNEGEDEHRNQRSEDSEEDDKSGFFACYLLTSLCPRYKGHTYIGFTVNPKRRIRQHNGELCSGAWRTKKKRPWEMVLCIYGFPTNVTALQFEWAWQHPVESLAVRKAAVGFKSLGGLANKIKLAYTMLTLPTWNNLNLSVNFFSTKYTKHYAGCPTLPRNMRVHIRSMDELPCYTQGYNEDEEDIFRFENGLSDDHDDNDDEQGKSLDEVTIPVLCSRNHQNNEEKEQAMCASDTDNNCDDDEKEIEKSFEDTTIPNSFPANHYNNEEEQEEEEAICVLDTENHEPSSSCTNKNMWDEVNYPDRQINEKEAICVSDDENNEHPTCGNIPKWSFMNSDYFNVVSPIMVNKNGEMDCVVVKDRTKKKICGEVEVVDLFTPSPEYRISSRKKRRGSGVVCPEIIDLTESPLCV